MEIIDKDFKMNVKQLLLENDIQRQIANYLIFKGFDVVRYNGMSVTKQNKNKSNRFIASYYYYNANMRSGHPDLIAYKNNYALMLEIKKQKGKLTENQKIFHKCFKQNGNMIYVVRSIEDVDKILKELEI